MIAPPGVRASSPELHRRASSVSSSSSQAPPGPEWRKRRSRRAIQRMHMRNRANRKLERRALRDSGIALSAIVDSRGYSMRPPRMPRSPTAGVSNTVCVTISAQGGPVWTKAAEELSEFGEIARLDVSLSITLGTVLVTYFDVRCAQMVMLHMASRAEPFQPASHDCRIVSVDLPGFCAKTGHIGGFDDFGEVAHVNMLAGHAVIEFYDFRSAQALLAAAGDSATPVPGDSTAPAAIARDLFEGDPAKLRAPPGIGRPAAAPTQAFPKGSSGIPDSAPEQAGDAAKHRVTRTKITNKDFRKFDIDTGAILRGEDKRTTVMVRHLQGICARKEFLLFLDKCGLGNRYSFFYMPCKEHRNIPAGFAFANFASPHDVHTLYGAVAGGLWREVCGSSPTKSPAVSYARFQGHEDLVQHFSLSVVLQEQDPEKRPIFRPEVLHQSSSARDPMQTKKALRIPGPPGIADEAEIPDHAGPPAEGAASSEKLVLSSKELQEAVEALLRKQAHSSKDSSVVEAPTSSEKVRTMVGRIGDEESEAFCSRMTGA